MAIAFTPEQQQVIDLRDRNILVSAAAGSGKTAVLVERIIQMISDENRKVDIDRLLVVTFTNAAAAEMRERIRQAISLKLEQEPENEHLQRQATLLHNAQITTIDSFCLFIIRNNFNDIGLDPGFRVADEGELKLMKQDVLTELLEQQYGERNADFLDCVEYFTQGSNDKLLEEYILKLYEFAVSYPWPEEWLKDRQQDYSAADSRELEESSWCRYLTDYAKTALRECAAQLSSVIDLAQKPGGPYFYGELLEKERDMLEKAGEKESFTALYEEFEAISFGRLPGKKDDSVRDDYRKKAQQIRNEVKKQVEELRTNYFLLSPEQILARMQLAQKPLQMLVTLVLQFKALLDARKRQENIIDFQDMEHFALQILLTRQEDGSHAASSAAREYRQFFQEILIDEYQDSNLVQELLLKSISGEEEGHFNRFMVGDVKQSIYKFRLARPELFLEKYNRYSRTDSVRQRIDLHRNFRSRKEVLDSVNRLFGRIMGKKLGGVEYDAEVALYPGASFPEAKGNETETLIIGRAADSRLSVREQEAAAIAERIRRLMRDFQVTDKESGALRPLQYKDIVILLRTASGWAEEFRGIFEKEGIPAYVASGTGYFQTSEVRELLLLLHVLDNPLQDIPLYGVMKSFFGNFTEEEIARIRSHKEKGSLLYENLLAFEVESSPSESLGGRLERFLAFINRLRQKASYTPIHRLIQEILMETGYLEYVAARPGGEQRRANVEMLLTRAAAFEKTSYYGLFHFLRYMEQLEKYQVDYGEADILDENADVVRIMSIHKSKGLEFPVCFVAGLSKRFNRQDTTGRMIADVDMGIGVDYVDSSLRVQSRTLRKSAIAMKLKLDNLGEELRILYVAMTRAREKLILTAVVSNLEQWREDLEEDRELTGIPDRVPFSVLAGADSYLDFIRPCLEEPIFLSGEEQITTEIKDTLRISDRKRKLLLSEGDNEFLTKMSQKLSRQYPYHYLSELYVKTTVSELKKEAHELLPERSMQDGEGGTAGSHVEAAFGRQLYEEPEVVPYIPSFIKEKEGMSGTDRGSAYHKIMELLDFAALHRVMQGQTAAGEGTENKPGQEALKLDILKQELRRQMEEMEESGRITGQQKEAVALPKLLTFLQSILARRMMVAAEAGALYREQPFVLGLAADRINPVFPSDEMILIQGIIDVYLEEEDQILVADYKTDRVTTARELTDRYRIQLDYYTEALERLTGKKVKERIIYSFALGKEILL